MPTGFKGFQKRNKINLGKKYSEERNNKISQSLKGRKVWNDGKHWSEEIKRKISEAHKGQLGYWKGKKRPDISEYNRKYKIGTKHSEETRKKISETLKKHPNRYWLGKKMSEKTKRKMGKAHKGEKNYFWQGGKFSDIYTTDWTDDLKESIRKRDDYVCQICGIHQDELERELDVHHKDYNKHNLNPDNLISLCHSCHMKTNNNRNYWVDYFKKLKLNN